MFDIGKILKRAWQVLWNYRVLWVFGLLLALTGAAGSGGSGGGGSSNYRSDYSGNYNTGRYENPFEGFNGFSGFDYSSDTPQWAREMGTWFQDKVAPLFATPETALRTSIWMVVIIFGACLLLGLLFALVRYPAETAVIRMVDEHETTGAKVKFKDGWKLGWNRRAFRIWLVDLVISLPALLFVALVVGMGILLAVNSGGMDPRFWTGMTLGIGLLVLFGLVFALFMIAVSLLREMVVRFIAIEDKTFGEAFSAGWTMYKKNFGHLLITWLVMLLVGIGFGIALAIAFFILIPAYAVLTIPGVVVAAIPGIIGYGITSLFAASSWAPWAIGILVALPFLVTIVFLPIYFLNGWYVVFNSNVFTLAYRQFKFIASIPPVPAGTLPVPPTVQQG